MSIDYYIKTYRSLKGKAILKISSMVFRETYALFAGFEIKSLRESVFLYSDKTRLKFCPKS